MTRTPINRRGQRTKAWESCRRNLKVEFERAGITRCELCGSDFALSFAHPRKRRFITSDTEMMEVALLCAVDHADVESKPHDEMERIIKGIIAEREERERV